MEETIEVTAWADLRELPVAMDEFAAQAGAIVGHAEAWMCRRAGFEPSPACVLSPLAEAMDPLRAGCAEVGRWFAADWADLREGVLAAAADLRSTDERVAGSFPEVA
jgi:hypothetical protein